MSTSRFAGSLNFGPFELHPERRQLLDRGEPVRLGSRALELLIALTEKAGELMSRSELEARLWPSTLVEETSLRVHVSALRKALGEGCDGVRYIANVPGRGYSFVAPVERACGLRETRASEAVETVEWRDSGLAHSLPGRVARVIGRAEVIESLTLELQTGPLVSLVGAGGMGKTTVALLMAQRGRTQYADGARFVDFSPLPEGSAVLSTLADGLELEDRAGDLWSALEAHLRRRHMLLVLDNCEHVIQSAAELVERLLLVAPDVRILATSREALEVQGERVYRLEGLQTPADAQALSLEQVRQLSAVQLFIERASAATASFELRDSNLKAVCDICQRLDGMPLAIELAAARVDALGIEGLAARLEHMFEVLTRGRRTALPRHRTLLALLDWSHALLSEAEQAVLRRLSLFRSSFTLELVASLCRGDDMSAAAVVEALMSLVAKSLIAVDKHGDALQYRLLYTTRTYAEEKLADSGEREIWRQRHAQTLSDLLESALGGTVWPWAAELAHLIEDVNLALEWTLTPTADVQTSVKLVMEAFMFMQRGGVVRNLREPLETMFEKLRLLPQPRPQLELRLRMALSFIAPSATSRYRTERLADRTLELVAEVGDAGDHIELQYALYIDAIRRADYQGTRKYAQAIRDLSTGAYEPLRVVLGDRLLVLALHHCGDHAQAWTLSQQVLAYRVSAPIEARFSTAIPYVVSMGGVQARIRWLQGFAQEAQAICDGLMLMLPGMVPVAACQFIGLTALPLALWRGDLLAARKLHQALQGPTAACANAYWVSWERMLGRALQVRMAGGHTGELADVHAADGDMELEMLPTLVPQWITLGALERAEAGKAGWCAPELLRASAEKLMARADPADWPAAQALLLRARELAVSQRALAWQLRIAISLARLRLAQGRPDEGREQLEDVLSRFNEGRQDADQQRARQLLALLVHS